MGLAYRRGNADSGGMVEAGGACIGVMGTAIALAPESGGLSLAVAGTVAAGCVPAAYDAGYAVGAIGRVATNAI